MTRKAYIIINCFFIAFITGIFIYCYYSNFLGVQITCVHHQFFGIDCPSCGLTRSFSALLQSDFQSAITLNKFGLQIFLFFLIQFSLRFIFLLVVAFYNKILKTIVKADAYISIVLFLFCFYPFIISTFYTIYKMLPLNSVSL